MTSTPTTGATGEPALALTLPVTKSLADFTATEVASVQNGVVVYLIAATLLTAEQIVRVDLEETTSSRKRSATITATAVLDQSAGLSATTAITAAATATLSNETVSFRLDGETVSATPTILATTASAFPTLTTTAPPAEAGDDDELSSGSIAIIFIFSMLAIAMLAGITVYAKAEREKRQMTEAANSAKSPRISISEAFDEPPTDLGLVSIITVAADETCTTATATTFDVPPAPPPATEVAIVDIPGTPIASVGAVVALENQTEI